MGHIYTWEAVVAKGEHKVVDISNDKKADIIVYKKDAQIGQLLAGAIIKATLLRAHTPPYNQNVSYTGTTDAALSGVVLRVTVSGALEYRDVTTGADGTAVIMDMEPGWVTVVEQKTKEALVEWGKVTTVEFLNTPKNPLLIKKIDSKTGEPLEGAVFSVTKVNGEYVGEFTTGRNCFITVTGIDPGFFVT